MFFSSRPRPADAEHADAEHQTRLLDASPTDHHLNGPSPLPSPITKRRYVFLSRRPRSQSFLQKVRDRMSVPTQPDPATAKNEETKEHREAIKTLLDEFMEQHEKAKGRLATTSDDGKGSEKGGNVGTSSVGSEPSKVEEISKRKKEKNLERFLMTFSTALQRYGCPTHILEFHMHEVAKGLGLAKAHFAVFPTYTLVAFNKEDYEGLGGQTLFFKTCGGMDMYRLQLVDEIARRVASYASVNPPVGQNIDAGEMLKETITPHMARTVTVKEMDDEYGKMGSGIILREEKAKDVELQERPIRSAPSLDHPPEVNTHEKHRFWSKHDRNERAQALRKAILNLSSYGPGFLYDQTRKRGKSNGSRSSSRAIYEDIFARLALEDANDRLEQVIQMEPLYPRFYLSVCYGTAAAGCSALFFGGAWLDMLASFTLGCMVGFLGNMTNSVNFSRVYEFCSAVIVGFAVRTMVILGVPICYQAVSLSSCVWLVQGLTITMSMIEIAARNMMSGTARLVYGLVITAIIGYGLDLGTVLSEKIFQKEPATSVTCTNPIQPLWYLVLFFPTLMSFNMLIHAHHSQFLPMLTMEAIAFTVSYFTYPIMGYNVSAGVSSFTAGAVSNLYARWSGHPAIIYDLAALLVLVPGCMAVRGFSGVMTSNTNVGLQLAQTVLLSAISIGIGLFMARLLVSPEEALIALRRQKKFGKLSSLAF